MKHSRKRQDSRGRHVLFPFLVPQHDSSHRIEQPTEYKEAKDMGAVSPAGPSRLQGLPFPFSNFIEKKIQCTFRAFYWFAKAQRKLRCVFLYQKKIGGGYSSSHADPKKREKMKLPVCHYITPYAYKRSYSFPIRLLESSIMISKEVHLPIDYITDCIDQCV